MFECYNFVKKALLNSEMRVFFANLKQIFLNFKIVEREINAFGSINTSNSNA